MVIGGFHLHTQPLGYAKKTEELEQYRDDNGPTADPEQSGEDARDDPGDDDPRRQPAQFRERCAECCHQAFLQISPWPVS